MTAKIDWSKVEALIADGGYFNQVSLTDSDACLCLVALNLLTNPELWFGYDDYDEIESAVDAAISAVMLPNEMVFNGHFAEDINGWTNNQWDSMYWDDHTAHLIEATAAYANMWQNIGVAQGITYDYRTEVEKIAGGNLLLQHGPNSTIRTMTSSGIFTGQFVGGPPSAFQGHIRFKASTMSCEWRVEVISVWESG